MVAHAGQGLSHVAVHPENGLNLISLCTGGGGLDLGVELAIPGARSVVLVEREAYAVARLVSAMEAGLLAPAAVWSDARTFNGLPWRGLVDGVIGGIPCQPHSLAGKRLGAADERDLWGPARRIIVQSRAWFVLIENVGGMLSSGGGERVWRDLSRLGFAIEAGLFAAAEVGASHERQRLFVLAVADARCGGFERRGGAGVVSRAQGTRSASATERQWHGDPLGHGFETLVHAECTERRSPAAGGSLTHGCHDGRAETASRAGEPSPSLADADLARSSFNPRQPGDGGAERAAVERDGGAVADAARQRRREGRAEPDIWDRLGASAGARGAMDDAASKRGRAVSVRERGQVEAETDLDRPSLFPPGPGDRAAWGEILARAPHLEPAIRRVADGVATRVDELRMLGNGVVPLAAAYALRTLVTRLAARGSAGAAVLASMMGER